MIYEFWIYQLATLQTSWIYKVKQSKVIISEALGMKLGSCEQGLVVTHIEENSVADVIGLKPGDIIFKVN